jgi:hypothetical protein
MRDDLPRHGKSYDFHKQLFVMPEPKANQFSGFAERAGFGMALWFVDSRMLSFGNMTASGVDGPMVLTTMAKSGAMTALNDEKTMPDDPVLVTGTGFAGYQSRRPRV